jgi:hypothetical protein
VAGPYLNRGDRRMANPEIESELDGIDRCRSASIALA